MSPISPLPAIAALCIATLPAALLARKFGTSAPHRRFAPLDGLRGLLAFLVFLHHACIWYFYLRLGNWGRPPSILYTQFGQASVALFFMITALLFWNKLIDAEGRAIDWLRLFVSRLLRLAPLYLLAVGLLLIGVAIRSRGVLNESPFELAAHVGAWLLFTLPGEPDVNRILDTRLLIAGVNWSLPYEWLFYGVLPLCALGFGLRPSWRVIALALSFCLGMFWWQPVMAKLWPFAGGIAAAHLLRLRDWSAIAVGPFGSLVAVACLGAACVLFPTVHTPAALGLLALFFFFVAAGNSLFGVLVHPVFRLLGDIGYSVYLLHGLLLYVTFEWVLGHERAARLSETGHWLVVLGCVPVLIVLSYVSFRTVELPAMQRVDRLTAWCRTVQQRALQSLR